MTEQELTYQEVMAALPGYATGLLPRAQQAAVDRYLQRQITLFQRLDELEDAAGGEGESEARAPSAQAAFAEVMEGQRAQQRLADNPLLMRNAPQSYTDRRTGQRFVVPNREPLQTGEAPRHFPARPTPWYERLRRLSWNLLALLAVIALLLIGAYQFQLQRQLAATQEQLVLMQRAERVLFLQGGDLQGSDDTTPMRGTLFLRGQRALLTVTEFAPPADGKIYQLWYTTATGEQYNGGVVSGQHAQMAPQLFVLPVPATAVIAAGLSIEPDGGSAAPTLPLILQGSLPTE